MESMISKVAIAVIGGDEYRISVAKPPRDRDFPW